MTSEPQVPGVSAFDGYTRLAKTVGQVAAPTALLGSLMYYFGYFHVYYFCNYFGINSTVLGMSNRDFIMQSADGLFVPISVLAALVISSMWGFVALPRRLRYGVRPRWLVTLVSIVAMLVTFNGLSRLFVTMPSNRGLCVAPSCIILGLLALWWAVVQRRRILMADKRVSGPATTLPTSLESLVVVILIGGALFWIANDYSVAVGQSRAHQFEREMPTQATAVVFSEKNLHLDGPGVQQTRCAGADEVSSYSYRYDGLILIMQAGDNYVLLPRAWSTGQGGAVVLPRSGIGAVRLEFMRPSDSLALAPCL